MFGWMEIGFIIVQRETIFVAMDFGQYHIEVVSISLVNGEIIVEVIIGLLGVGDRPKDFFQLVGIMLSALRIDDESINKKLIRVS